MAKREHPLQASIFAASAKSIISSIGALRVLIIFWNLLFTKAIHEYLYFARTKTKEYCQKYKEYFAKYSQSLEHIRFIDCTNNSLSHSCVDTQTSAPSGEPPPDKTLFKVSGVPDNRKITVYDFRDKLRAKIPLKNLVDPSPALKYFSEILLLDKQGSILYRSGTDDISKTGNFDALDDFARFENFDHYLQTDEVIEWNRSSKKISKQRVNLALSHSTVRSATIGSISYKLFVQPFHAAREQIVESKGDAEKQNNPVIKELQVDKLAYLVGIVSKKKHVLDIISLPLERVTVLLFIVLFIILLIPHFKLEFSGPHFMPSRTLAASLAISLPLLVVLLGTGLLGTRDYFRLKQGLTGTAKAIATMIQGNFSLEFGGLRDVNICPDSNRLKNSRFSVYDELSGDSSEIKAVMAKANDSFYPDFELGFFLNKEGEQIGKQFIFRSFPSAPAKVQRRDYFKQPYFRPESLMTWPAENGNGDPQPFYSERIQTYDQGVKLTVFSRPWSTREQRPCIEQNEDEENPSVVHALIKLMHTFFEPVLPLGFGFAVIKDMTGDVVYHSNDQRSLLENFYIETDQNDSLIAAVQSRHAQSIDGRYNGIHHGFWVTPVANMPWTLIVFYDTSLMEVAHLKGWIFSLVLAVFPIILVLILLYFLYPLVSEWLERFAPHGQYWISERARFPFVKNNFKFIYVIVAEVVLVIIFGSWAWVTYNAQFSDQMERLSKLNLAYVGHQLIDRKIALTHEVGRLIPKEKDPVSVKDIRYLEKDCNLYEFSIYATAVKPDADSYSDEKKCLEDKASFQPRTWLVAIDPEKQCSPNLGLSDPALYFEEALPLLSRLDANHRLMMYNNASDRSWSFKNGANNTLCAELRDHGNQQSIKLTGALDPSENPVHPESSASNLSNLQITLLVLYPIVTLYLLFNLIKQIARRLMGLRFPPRGEWRNYFKRYQSESILELAPPLPDITDPDRSVIVAERNRIAEKNLKKIVSGVSEPLLELKSILFHRSNRLLINTDNTEPLMWLILGGLFQYDSRGIDFENLEMKKWVREQNWSKQIHDYEATSRTDLWRVLAPAFYATLLLAIGYLVLSGGHIGELIISLLPVALAGGIPFISQLFEKFVRE